MCVCIVPVLKPRMLKSLELDEEKASSKAKVPRLYKLRVGVGMFFPRAKDNAHDDMPPPPVPDKKKAKACTKAVESTSTEYELLE